ncbi:MAG TPA: hypothetical protein P5121_34820, partial [Caldilineaceae bacterium]|nr:hypothetical protein [Caldilineaceae bacterium]
YRSRLPCANPENASLQVLVTQPDYAPHDQTVALVGETKEILLTALTTPTPTATATPNATPTATRTATPTPCASTINPYTLTARQRAGVACPAQGWVPSRIVEVQEFEGGFMIVFDDPANDNFQEPGKQRKSYLLANDGRAWRVYFESDDIPQLTSPDPNEWYTCEPQPGMNPAESGVPWRRFGLIWCTYPQIRTAFGRALGDEITTDASFQSYYQGRVFQLAGDEGVYIIYLDADDETIDDRYLTGTWELRSTTGTTSRGTASTPTRAGGARFQPEVEIVCNDTKGQVWFSGTVTENGKPVNGYRVLFKSTKVPGDEPATDPVVTGPSAQHRDWAPGYYEHFVDIYAATASSKSLQIWITDSNWRKVSADAYWQTDGGSGKCNKAVINFTTD